MVVASGGWVKYANSPDNQNSGQNTNQNNTNLNDTQNNKMTAKAVLICRENSHHFEERTLSLQKPVRIGRSVGKVRATSHNAIFDCKVLSRNHALLWFVLGKFYLQDTSSSNGTFVNNERLSASGVESAPIEVCSGDVVQFGVDVVESAKKVRHGCIIATLKLYLPDGKEAKASLYTSIADLYRLNQVVQEASKRERSLYSKLGHLQKLVENTRNAANQSWKALIAEDHLLSWVETLESQLAIYKKNYSKDKVKSELIKLQEEKAQYQNTAKEALQKVLQEKLEVTQRLVELERRLSETEEECQSLHNVAKYTQMELQELSNKYADVEKQLEETTCLLVQKDGKCREIMQNAEQEKLALQKKLEEQYKIEICLEARLRNSQIDSVNMHKQITALRNYMQTLQDMNSKIISDSKEEQNPIEAINAILNQLNSINADNIDVNTEADIYLNKTEHDNQLNSQDIDSNQLKVMNAESSFVKDQLDDSGSIPEYILPPPSRQTLVNGSMDVENADNNDKSDTDFETTEDTCSINDDSCSIASDDFSEKSVIEGKHEKDTIDIKDSLEPQKLEVRFVSDENSEQLKISYELGDHRTTREIDDFSNTTNDHEELDKFSEKTIDLLQRKSSKREKQTKESTKDLDPSDNSLDLKSMFDRLIVPQLSAISDKNDKITEPEETAQCTELEKRQVEAENVPDVSNEAPAEEKEEEERREVKFSMEHELESVDQRCTKALKCISKTEKPKINVNQGTETTGEDEQLNEEYMKTLKPLSKNDSMGQNLQARDYFLETLIRSLQSLKDEDNLQAQQVVQRELEELRDWISSESTKVVIDRLKDVYYRVKNEAQRVQEVSEELVILKEKYNAFVEEKAELTKKYTTLKAQCGDLLNASYTIPIHYVAPIVLALIWMLLEKIF